jgi:hypothetical protein
VAEERKRLGEGSAAQNHLGSSARHRVEGGEPLVDPDGVVGAEDRDSRAEADAPSPRGDGREHDLRGADGEVRAVVLADAEEVHPQIVGQCGLGYHVAEDLRVREKAAVGTGADVAERVEAQLDGWHADVTYCR